MARDPVIELVRHIRTQLLIARPFYGQMALRLDLVIVEDDKWCTTAATDGRRLYINREFAKKCTPAQLGFVVAHEALHCCFMHMFLRGNRDPKIWNHAGDALINYMLKNDKVGDFLEGCIYDERYNDELTTAQIYDILIENSTLIELPFDVHLDGASGKPNDDGKDGNGSGGALVRVMGEDGPPTLTEEEIEELKTEIQSSLIAAVAAGNAPLGIRRLVGRLSTAILDWRSMLDAHLRSTIKANRTFRRISRRSFNSKFILPGRADQPMVEVACIVDTSGSMSEDMIRDLLSEVKAIMLAVGNFKLMLWTFDTQVYGYKEFTPQNLDEIDEYVPQGGGGTDFMVNWEFMRANDIIPERIVFFTDGMPCGQWGEREFSPTLYVIHGSKTIVPPFGTYAYYEPKAKVREAKAR